MAGAREVDEGVAEAIRFVATSEEADEGAVEVARLEATDTATLGGPPKEAFENV